MSRSTVSNPKKLRKISALVGREIIFGFYRGGWSDERGHFFMMFASDGTAWYVSSRLKDFERCEDPPDAVISNRTGLRWDKDKGIKPLPSP